MIELIAVFLIAVNQRANELTYSNMQIIAREIELEVMRRSAPKQDADNSKRKQLQKAITKPKPQNHLQRLTTWKAPKSKDLVCFFFILYIFSQLYRN